MNNATFANNSAHSADSAVGFGQRLIDGLGDFALTFSGQGYPWLPTLREQLAAGSAIGRDVEAALKLLAPLGDELAGFLPHGFDPVAWARSGAPAGLDAAAAAVSTPGIVTAQLALLEVLRAQGLPAPRQALGHSQGVLATYAALGKANAAEVIAQALLIGAAITKWARIHGLVRTAQGAPMVAVSGASRAQLEAAGATIGLCNGHRNFVIVGAPGELDAVRAKLEAAAAAEQRAVELKQRGGTPLSPVFNPLDVQAAYHHPAMVDAVADVERWAGIVGLDAQLVGEGARAVLVDPVDWPAQLAGVEAEWIFECGPAGGVAKLTQQVVAGRGIGTLVLSSAEGQAQLFDAGRAPARPRPWSDFAPRRSGDRVVTKFTDATGLSPVMLPGMTPTTVDPEIVAAAANAGHWAELAGGGQVTDAVLADNLAALEKLLEPGVNAQFNAMYLNAAQWRRQIAGARAIPRARAAGAPINGIVISAGIPPHEEAVELVEQLRRDNFPWLAFKPGAVSHIRRVLDVADAVDFPIIMQVEGGHAGGHHSWEALDDLLLDSYAEIRRRDNVILAVGGGIGTPEVGAEYLTGTWAQRYGRVAMPVDAIMVGTAAMAAREATATADVKAALVAARPVEDNDGWAPAGASGADVASGRSQLGADIHELNNSFARTAAFLAQVEDPQAQRVEIIEALARTCKPYFGDVAEMTYAQWLERYLELSYGGAWADESWAIRFEQMVHRAEARLHPADHGPVVPRVLAQCASVDEAPRRLVEEYGDAPVQPADAAWFLRLLDSPGKPANFVPVIDGEVLRRFRQDTLWQAQDPRYSADEVCIIPGTVAVAGIERADEPVAQLLGRFEAAAAVGLDEEAGQVGPAAADCASIEWAGRQIPNPARVVDNPQLDQTEDGVVLRVEMEGSVPGARLDIPLRANAIPGATPVVTEAEACAAMRELARIAAGGSLPEVAGGQASCRARLDAADRAGYDNVTAGYAPGVSGGAADILVGKAWPAIFAVIADTDAVEGLLDLVHLHHGLTLAAPLPAGDLELEARARLGGVKDTVVGRVIEVSVEFVNAAAPEAGPLARLHEEFAIRGRQGSAPYAAPRLDFVAKPESFRHRQSVRAPESMRAFAVVTGDRNPIHVDANAARLAGLDGVIVHGMWTSALAQLAAAFDGAQVTQWAAEMLAPVAPGAEVVFDVARIGRAADGGEVRSVTAQVDGTPVLAATAVLAAPRTFYGFPGQGIQHPGMGMDAYASSPAARAVWDRADRHTRRQLGFSILEIVRTNPPRVEVDGEVFEHPDGALFLTQFTQVAMATLGCAQVAEMEEAGVLQHGAFFAGHSVGEYNALAAYARVLSLESVVEIVYRRGLTMHRLVGRDSAGNSNYGLSALRPNKMGLSADEVFDYVAQIARETGEFLEIVNYNIAGVQYAVAGTRAGLAALAADAERRAPGKRAYIAIPGIDVPFHSSHLLDGVPEFRAHLDSLIPEEIDLDILVDRYLPNLVARPFALDREFVDAMAEVVDSPISADILADFDAWSATPVKLGRTLLIELLAWQFASPVRWIETQDLLLRDTADGGLGVERFVEVGVGQSPTLANMLGQTLRLDPCADVDIEVFNVERDRAAVYSEDQVEAPAAEPADAAEPTEPSQPSQPAELTEPTVPTAPAQPAAPAPTGGPQEVADKPFNAADATVMLVAAWTKVRPDQIGATDTIESLVEGVSSRRNQLLLDLGTEFGIGAIDGAADAPIAQLQETVAGLAKGYKAFGPVLGQQVTEALRRLTGPANKKPAYVAERITGAWGLGPGWVDRITAEIVLGTREGASLRGGDLAEFGGDLDAVIDAATRAAGQRVGVDIVMPAAAGAGSATVDSAALDEFAAEFTDTLAATAQTLLRRLGKLDESAPEAAEPDQLADLVAAELGPDWAQQVAPTFDARKAVLLDDFWAWAREDLVRRGAQARVTGAGEEVAQMAEYLGHNAQAADARTTVLPREGQVAVVTGASPSSIAAAVVGRLLGQGATVIATTSRLDHDRLEYYKGLYRDNAAGPAALWVVPANLSSFADVDALIDWVGTTRTVTVNGATTVDKPALVPDLLFPFAAPRVSGYAGDPGAESQMRLLLWSVERLLVGLSGIGAATHVGHRLHAVLPGSPNRGTFGGDGAYGESKAALDALVNRWRAEPWGRRVSLAHAHIGWVRGTGLMGGNDPLVDVVEARGVRTFAPADIAKLLVDQAADPAAATAAPAVYDFTGGLAEANLDLPALAAEAAAGADAESAASEAPEATIAALPNVRRPLEWTEPDFAGANVDLDDMVVIVGAGELGPVGSSRTRYEVELTGGLSAAGVIELAWSTGLISWDEAAGGWVTADGEDIAEADIFDRFHDQVLAGVGVRRYHDDFGPHLPMVDNLAPELTTIYLEEPLTFTVEDEETARSFLSDGESGATISFDGEWHVTRPAGSPVRVPRRLAMSRFVGGQIPEGFDPARYGLPADMIDNLDRAALWNIVCTVDAFLSAGFSPAELLAHVHPARVSSTQGTGMGGTSSLRSLYVDKLLAQARPNDILQEALPNVVAAHVMQSYVGGYGQMIHPVAACATAAVSVEEAMDKLRLHKADFVVAGGIDDLSIEGITGFGDMAATADSQEMADKGIEDKYFSRANDRRRGGFIESEGGGTLLLARGSLAKEMGLPVIGVVAFAESFADGAHTSIPAPGLGALSAARGGADSRLARALGAHGVSPDEVAVVSKHDTSTTANDPNESDLHERIASSMGRAEGNPLYVISQKTLTGHAKGGAAAFQLIGLTQVLREGVLPPNRSLDCVDPQLREHKHLTWLRRPLDLRATPPKAGLVTSLGFGHVSALVAVVHPGVFAQAAGPQWRERAQAREAAGLRRFEEAMRGGAPLYERPVDRNLGSGGKELEARVLLDETARLREGVLAPQEEPNGGSRAWNSHCTGAL